MKPLFLVPFFMPVLASAQPAGSFSFGLVADVQYADKAQAGAREYRASLGKLERCVEAWNRQNLAFIIQLGDLVDAGADNLDRILPVYQRTLVQRYHVIGNHDLVLPRLELQKKLGLEAGYYSFARLGWRFVVVDAMDVSVQAPGSAPSEALAKTLLAELKARREPNAQDWNGGIGPRQLAWLDRTLAGADEAGERVIVFCHLPVLAAASTPMHLLWNHGEVLALLERHRSAVAWFSGHDHAGGYAQRAGVHHVTFPGLVESGANAACSTVQVARERIDIQGIGTVPSRSLALHE